MDITEIYEMLGVYGNMNNRRDNSQFILRNRSMELSHKYCDSLKPWQNSIVNQLRTGDDLFVIVAPGGGKTLPITCYWIQYLLQINLFKQISMSKLITHFDNLLYTPENLPKLSYLVPTRTLAQQTIQDIINNFSNILSQLLNYRINSFWNSRANPYQIDQFKHWIRNNVRRNYSSDDISLMFNQIFSGKPNDNDLKIYRELIIEATNNFINNKLIYIKTGGQSSRGNPDNSPVIVSIYQSANSSQMLKAIAKSRLIICDEAHLTQPVSVLSEDPKNAEQIALSLYDVLRAIIMKQQSQLVFLSGTQNPNSAKEFAKYLNKHFNRKFNINNIKTTGSRNQAKIDVIPDDDLTNIKGMVDSINSNIRLNEWGNLYVVFSIKQMQKICAEVLKKIGAKNLSSIQQTQSHDMNFQSYMGQNRYYKNSRDIRIKPEDINHQHLTNSQNNQILKDAKNIENLFLRDIVSHGIGVISRNVPSTIDSNDKIEMSESDKFIISSLFKERKLKVLLATDAVGIGVNIDVKRIYIPSIEKFSGMTKQNEEIIMRDLSQILNRVGRSATTVASIHSPQENIQKIMLALNLDPDNFETSEIVKKIPLTQKSFKYVYMQLYHTFQSINNDKSTYYIPL